MAHSTEGNSKIAVIKKCLTAPSRQMIPLVMFYAGPGVELNDPDGYLSNPAYSVILCFYIFQDYIETLNITFMCLVSLTK